MSGFSFGPLAPLKLSRPTIRGPMAVASHKDSSDNTFLILVYLISSNDRSVAVAKADLSCKRAAYLCSETGSAVLSDVASHKVHPATRLAAAWISETQRYRVYYQLGDGSVVELSDDGDAGAWKSRVVATDAVNGTGLAATVERHGQPAMSLYYASRDAQGPVVRSSADEWRGGEF